MLAYVLLDGFDLGIALLFPFWRDRAERHLVMNTIAPVWDGNETWLVLGGGGLFAVFPLAYAIVMPALYPLIIAMLLGLIFRGVAFEFIHRSRRKPGFWEFGFFAGSLIATLAQGIALGALVQGIKVQNRAYAGGNWDWLSGFSLLTGVALLAGYATLGATWIIAKTEGDTKRRAQRLALPACVVLVLMTLIITALTIGNHPEYVARWIAWPTIFYSGLVPILMTFAGVSFGFGLRGHHDLVPFLATIAIFILSFIGLGTRFYPNLAPRPDHCAGRRPRHIPAVSTGGRGPIDPDDPDRHALFLLGLSRQGSPRRRLSLMRKALWFLGLYAASILALGTVALAIRAALFW